MTPRTTGPDEARPADSPQDGSPQDDSLAGDEPSLNLEDQFCFTLYSASRAVTATYRPLLERLNLTYPQYLVMLVLWQHGTTTVKELVHTLHLDYGTLTPLLKRLETAGLLTRHRRPEDERVVDITPTEDGLDLRRHALAVPPALGAAFNLSGQDIQTANAILTELIHNLTRP
ncbi:MarR family winged helix-turn-helix transcriptional regulator [Streptomyces sp. NPDC058459]|uniref:MarR family winged helix-turn-helix transcriptional regulator n=1 Tax=Streptomyces sp. NPDC058459 TaxID=3346508 RepID=UPI00365F2F12